MELNSRDLVVAFAPTQARAVIGVEGLQHVFSMNPDEVKWSYKSNTVSRDTIGGRVVQILSASTESMTVSGRAGSRRELQLLSNNLKRIMQLQIKTGEPVQFKVPSRNWNFLVYIQNLSGLGWDVTTTSYPYQITLMVQDDLSGALNKVITNLTFENLEKGMGYNSKFHGGDADYALKYAEATLNMIGAVGTTTKTTKDETDKGDDGPVAEDAPGCESNKPNIQRISPYCKRFVEEIIDVSYPRLKRPAGVFCCKKVLNSNTWSDHSWGAAVDVGYAHQSDQMAKLARFAANNASIYKIKYVIYNRQIWTVQDQWHSYSGDNPHTDHVHISFLDSPAADGVTPPCA